MTFCRVRHLTLQNRICRVENTNSDLQGKSQTANVKGLDDDGAGHQPNDSLGRSIYARRDSHTVGTLPSLIIIIAHRTRWYSHVYIVPETCSF